MLLTRIFYLNDPPPNENPRDYTVVEWFERKINMALTVLQEAGNKPVSVNVVPGRHRGSLVVVLYEPAQRVDPPETAHFIGSHPVF